jgi:RNA polymerase sigma-70 factor, ECF subfamily
MQTTEALGLEPQTDVSIRDNGICEMQDVLSRYRPAFYRQAYRYLGNEADAEDAVQDALLSAYKHLNQFKGEAQMSTWLTSIVINCARMRLRTRLHHPAVSLDEHCGDDDQDCVSERLADNRPSPEDRTRESELHRYLIQFVAELSPSLRRAFELRDLDELTTSEAAHVLGVAQGTLKAQVSRARAKLSRLMRRTLGRRLRPTPPRFASSAVEKKRGNSQVPDECAALLA